MGTHPNGPSEICKDGQCKGKLDDWIKQNPTCLGSKVKDYFHGNLPFLFKVLSVNNSLSIQAHPNKVKGFSAHLTQMIMWTIDITLYLSFIVCHCH
jgi:mannose-6-phosphate isomerase